MPRNATVRGDGFRMYPWPGGDTELNRKYNAVEPSDLLSVTSIRTLCGLPYQLATWQQNNIVNVATGMRQVVRIGPRGGVKKVYVKDGEFPGEFVRRMLEGGGSQESLDANRAWLKAAGDEPRDVAAVRGSVVHKMIEDALPLTMIDEDLIRKRFAMQWAQEKRKVKPEVLPEDVNFAFNGLRQYWHMRERIPYVLIAAEPQLYNLTAGYGGSADCLLWFLGTFDAEGTFTPLPGITSLDIQGWQSKALKKTLTLADVESVGGTLGIGDYKTSESVQTGHVVQTTAYLTGEFIALDGIIDERLTALLRAATLGMIIHIRPNLWELDGFPWREDVTRAFIGSVQFARFLALYKKPDDLFTYRTEGVAPGTDASTEVTDDD